MSAHLALPVFAFLPLVHGILMAVFVLVCLLLMLVVLIQEGKGGGIAGAFGGAAAETFGVKAGSVNKFTSWLATIFIVLALVEAGISSNLSGSVVRDTPSTPTVPASTPVTLPPIEAPPSEPAMTDAPPAPPAEPAMTDAPPAPPAEPAMTDAPPTPPAEGTTPSMGT